MVSWFPAYLSYPPALMWVWIGKAFFGQSTLKVVHGVTSSIEEKMSMKFGLIGFGRWSNHHARAIVNTKGAELVAVSARSEESCKRARESFGVETYLDYKEMLKRKDIDVVDIVLPNYLHKQVAIEALNHGKHVLLEKPMAITVEECNAILKTVKKTRGILHIGFEMRISPVWKKVKEMIEKSSIGKPVYGIIELWRGPYWSGSNGWRYDAKRVGSWILEEPVHFFRPGVGIWRKLGNLFLFTLAQIVKVGIARG